MSYGNAAKTLPLVLNVEMEERRIGDDLIAKSRQVADYCANTRIHCTVDTVPLVLSTVCVMTVVIITEVMHTQSSKMTNDELATKSQQLSRYFANTQI
jgi:hypothetical protein